LIKKNQFKISDKMAKYKKDLPEWTWDDIIKFGLNIAELFNNDNKQFIYKELYHLSDKSVKELIALFR
jgi:hypothetical protein